MKFKEYGKFGTIGAGNIVFREYVALALKYIASAMSADSDARWVFSSAVTDAFAFSDDASSSISVNAVSLTADSVILSLSSGGTLSIQAVNASAVNILPKLYAGCRMLCRVTRGNAKGFSASLTADSLIVCDIWSGIKDITAASMSAVAYMAVAPSSAGAVAVTAALSASASESIAVILASMDYFHAEFTAEGEMTAVISDNPIKKVFSLLLSDSYMTAKLKKYNKTPWSDVTSFSAYTDLFSFFYKEAD